MSAPLSEGARNSIDFDALLKPPDPTFELIEPKTAPVDMLEQVRVNTQGRCLETDTPLGTIAVEMYWQTDTSGEGEEIRGDFFPALDSRIDPDASTNPLATQAHPYTILPDGSLYQIAVRAPLEAVSTCWSPERTTAVGRNKLGISLAEFRSAYPGVEVDLPPGQYAITATERTRPVLSIVARVENGEPLTRTQEVSGSTVRYEETLTCGFGHSMLRPDTAVAVIDSRKTIRSDGKEADKQRLEFRIHDGFQRTGEGAEENSGVVELIVMQGEAVELTGFKFAPFLLPILRSPTHNDYRHGYGGSISSPQLNFRDEPKEPSGGLTGGETRYRPPETVEVSMLAIRELRAIAAFRFAMTGSHEFPAGGQA